MVRPTDFEAYRIWFRSMARLGDPRAYMVAAHLFKDERATREDRLEVLRVTARQAPHIVAMGLFAGLDEGMRESGDVKLAILPLLMARREYAMVERMLRGMADLAENPAARLELIRVLCAQPEVGRVAEARGLFAGLLAEGAHGEALEGLLLLGGVEGGLAPGEPFGRLAEWVDGRPEAEVRHRLLARDPLIAVAADAGDGLVAECVSRHLAAAPGELGDWLRAHGRAAEAAGLLAEPARVDAAAFVSRVRALLACGRADEALVALQEPPETIDLVELELVRVEAARQAGDEGLEAKAWNQALANAGFEQTRNRYLEVCEAAEKAGAVAALDDAWVAAVRVGWGALPPYRDLRPVFSRLALKGRTEDLLAMSRVLVRMEPDNGELANNYHYLALLHNVSSPGEVERQMELLIKRHPDSSEFLSALAMARLVGGEADGVLELVPAMARSERISPNMKKALEGTARMLKGDSEAGLELLKEINWDHFLRCESLAFRGILTGLQVKDLPLPEVELAVPTVDPESVPAWRKAVERLEKERASEELPPLPVPRVMGEEADPEAGGAGGNR